MALLLNIMALLLNIMALLLPNAMKSKVPSPLIMVTANKQSGNENKVTFEISSVRWKIYALRDKCLQR